MEQSFDCSMDGYLAESSPILFSAASSSFFFAAFRRLPPSSFCSIGSFINRASCFAALLVTFRRLQIRENARSQKVGADKMRGAVMGAFLVDPTDIAVLLSLT